MEDFAFLLKTHIEDLEYANRLLKSIMKFNVDKITVYIISEKNLENKLIINESFVFIDENKFNDFLIPSQNDSNSYKGFKIGYLNQQIIKLAFWELGLCNNYMCIDSDILFTREFFKTEFVQNKKPFTFYSEEKNLITDEKYYSFYFNGLEKYRLIIKEYLGIIDEELKNCHGMGIICSETMRKFKINFLKENSLTYSEIIIKAPIEFTWYTYWCQKIHTDLNLKEIPLKVYHTYYQYSYDLIFSSINGINKLYLGYIMNSNWSKKMNIDKFGDYSLKLIFRLIKDFTRRVILNKKW